MFRTFIDNWYGYYKGGDFVNRNGKPKWFNKPNPKKEKSALLQMDFISKNAKKLIDGLDDSKGTLVKDHSIPVKILRKLMINGDSGPIIGICNIEDFLLNHYRLGVITKTEDALFRDKKLDKKLISEMPKNWDGKEHFARYHVVGIDEA